MGLFTPAWKGKNEEKALEEIGKVVELVDTAKMNRSC